jgi:hypothetical protein
LLDNYANYAAVVQALEEIAALDKSQSGTIAYGLATVMQTFGFYLSLKSGWLVYSRPETLS